MRFSRSTRTRCALITAGVLSTLPIAARANPEPIWYEGLPTFGPLKATLDTCYGSCYAGAYSACYAACQATWGTCNAGCDVISAGCDTVCFFSPNSAACLDCLAELNNCRTACDSTYNSCISPCVDALHDCHRACVNTSTALGFYHNGNVGIPWFCGAPRDSIFQFGTLDYPYADQTGFYSVMQRWDANPKTVYIASGTQLTGSPLVINHPTWLVNNTPGSGPVLITP